MPVFKTDRPYRSRLIITGAAGGIGTAIAGRLGHVADEVVRSDIVEVTPEKGEHYVAADLTDMDQVRALLNGGGDVIHLGGQAFEAEWEKVRDRNLIGTYNLYEAARLEGVRRVLFASSNHAVGFHPREQGLNGDAQPRPDTLYGVSKVYGEALASLYYDKFGIESLSVRIGSCYEEPSDRRHMSTWLSFADFIRLIERFVEVPRLGNTMVYGISDNQEGCWNNDHAAFLGWQPQDRAEVFKEKVYAKTERDDPEAVDTRHVGGFFTAMGHPNDAEE